MARIEVVDGKIVLCDGKKDMIIDLRKLREEGGKRKRKGNEVYWPRFKGGSYLDGQQRRDEWYQMEEEIA